MIAIVLIGIRVQSLGNESTVYIQTIEGDSSVLEDVIISGLIQDKYHGLQFSLEEDRVEKKKEIYTHFLNIRSKNELDESIEKIVTFENGEYIDGFGIQKLRGYENIGVLLMGSLGNVNYPLSAKTKEDGGYYPRFMDNNYTVLNNELYFTITETLYLTGQNGIFKIENYHKEGSDVELDIKEVVTMPIDHKQDVNIIGITNLNNCIIVLEMTKDKLVVKAFDPNTGELVGKETGAFGDSSDHSYFRPSYRIYKAGNILNVYFHKRIGLEEVGGDILTFKVNDGIELVNATVIDNTNEDFEMHRPDSLDNVYYVNDKLFVFQKMGYLEDYYDRIFNYFLYVYEDNQLLYKGELKTDINDDLVLSRFNKDDRYFHRNSGIKLNYLQFRSKYNNRVLTDIQVEPKY